jgi:hypothetical protein
MELMHGVAPQLGRDNHDTTLRLDHVGRADHLCGLTKSHSIMQTSTLAASQKSHSIILVWVYGLKLARLYLCH